MAVQGVETFERLAAVRVQQTAIGENAVYIQEKNFDVLRLK
jgi:hypothetical protein